MKFAIKCLALLMVALVVVVVVTNAQTQSGQQQHSNSNSIPEMSTLNRVRVAHASDGFGYAVLRHLEQVTSQLANTTTTSNSNVLFSPLNLHVALSMLLAGSANRTRAQIYNALGYESYDKFSTEDLLVSLHWILDGLQHDITNGRRIEAVAIANSVALQRHSNLTTTVLGEGFRSNLTTYFGREALLSGLDFAHHPHQATEQINSWVKNQTRGKVDKLLLDQPMSSDTLQVLLLSALHFKGTWASAPFVGKQTTKKAEFHLSNGTNETVVVDMMSVKGHLKYAHFEDGSQMVQLPYGDGDGDLSMLVYLQPPPPVVGGSKPLSNAFNISSLNRAINQLNYRTVSVSLPKFRSEQTYSLGAVLQHSLGIEDVFSPGKADLSGIDPSGIHQGLHLSQVVHKTCIEVGEQGKAGANTCKTPAKSKTDEGLPEVEFRANRPFLYLVRHNDLGVNILQGIMNRP